MRKAADGESIAGSRLEIVKLLEVGIADAAISLLAFPDEALVTRLRDLLRRARSAEKCSRPAKFSHTATFASLGVHEQELGQLLSHGITGLLQKPYNKHTHMPEKKRILFFGRRGLFL